MAPIYDARDVLADPRLEALGSIATVARRPSARCGCRTWSAAFRKRRAEIRHAGRAHGADTEGGACRARRRAPTSSRACAPRMCVWTSAADVAPTSRARRPDRVEKAIMGSAL